MTKLANIFLARSHIGLAVFLSQSFTMMVIYCVYLPLGIIDAAVVAATFTRSAAATATATATFIYPTIASTGLNSGNLLGKLVLWHLGYCGCEVITRLKI